jgi:hypothetical protein
VGVADGLRDRDRRPERLVERQVASPIAKMPGVHILHRDLGQRLRVVVDDTHDVIVVVELLPGLGLLYHALDRLSVECLAAAHPGFLQREVEFAFGGHRRGVVHVGVATPAQRIPDGDVLVGE